MPDTMKSYLDNTVALMRSIAVLVDGENADLPTGIRRACRLLRELARRRKKVMFVGNGGSAGIAGHMAVDFWKNGGLKALAFNDSSLLTCVSNDCGYEQVFARPIGMFAEEGDLLIAISSSGRSPNILKAVKAAKSKKCRVITLSGFKADNPLRRLGDINFYVPSAEYGPVEVLHQFLCHFILDMYLKERKAS